MSQQNSNAVAGSGESVVSHDDKRELIRVAAELRKSVAEAKASVCNALSDLDKLFAELRSRRSV